MKICMLNTKNLYHHPNNPRNNYGDLTELSDSIRGIGILQNLTVVPYDPSIHKMTEPVADPASACVVIIGNRRLEAAKLAGLTEVPCCIDAQLSYEDQLCSMLSENNLREDANPRMEAENLQLMLDMGCGSVNDLAQKTGFSVTKIYNRIKLLELDADQMDAATQRGATLSDFAQLNKLRSAEHKNDVLKAIGTPDFYQKLNNAITAEAREQKLQTTLKHVSSFAKEMPKEVNLRDYIYVGGFFYYTSSTPVRPAGCENTDLFYIADTDYRGALVGYKVYRPLNAQDNQKEAERKQKSQEAAARMKAIEDLSSSCYDLRRNFIKSITPSQAKKAWPRIAPYVTKQITKNLLSYYSRPGLFETYADVFALKGNQISEDDFYENEVALEICKKSPELYWLFLAFTISDSDKNRYVRGTFTDIEGTHAYLPFYHANDDLDMLYQVLSSLGYAMSTEEKQLQNGSHPLFCKDSKN